MTYRMDYTEPVHIMLIDDDEINNFIVKILIKKICEKCSITTCLNAEEALQTLFHLKSNQISLPDYIFFEVNSPFMDGWLFLDEYERLSIDEENVGRIIVLTCSLYRPNKETALQYRSIGAYLIKPLTVQSFKNILEHKNVNEKFT
jgi:response regulator RpfG family c-di-GMP phosphodiesterase